MKKANTKIAAAATFAATLAGFIGFIPDGWWIQQAFMFLSGFMFCIVIWLCVEDGHE